MSAFVFLSILFMYSTFFNDKTEAVYGWVTLTVSLVLGIIVGILLAKISKLGVAVLAGWGGFCLGLVLWSAFLYYIKSQVFFWLFNVGLAIIFGVLSLFLYDYLMIISTAIIGSYGFIRGISFFAGKYPNEFTLVTLL
jgi:hypothetical protein